MHAYASNGLKYVWRLSGEMSMIYIVFSEYYPRWKRHRRHLSNMCVICYNVTLELTGPPFYRSSQRTPRGMTGKDLTFIASLFANFLSPTSNLSNFAPYWILLGGTDQDWTSFLIHTLWNCWEHPRGRALCNIPWCSCTRMWSTSW